MATLLERLVIKNIYGHGLNFPTRGRNECFIAVPVHQGSVRTKLSAQCWNVRYRDNWFLFSFLLLTASFTSRVIELETPRPDSPTAVMVVD
jgi:hypothetical protein